MRRSKPSTESPKTYGAEFVKYLPPAARASKWPRVERFWRGELLTEKPESTTEKIQQD